MLNQNHTYLLCKSKLETALSLYRNNNSLLSYPAFGKKHFKSTCNSITASLRKWSGNQELVVYYMMAMNRYQNKEWDCHTDKTHRIGSFLFHYFRGEGASIQFLEDLTIKLLNSLIIKQEWYLISTKPKPEVWGPAIQKMDDVWEYIWFLSQF